MTSIDNITVTFSAKHYAELLSIQRAMRGLLDFYEESDIEFLATDLTPSLRTLSSRLSVIFELLDKS